MPSSLTYPGVYIEEISSGVRTITGVATSITAFIGRTVRGPVNEPTIVNNFGQFERLFGGLAADHTVAYAVQDFFGNGGAQAIIVRLYKPFFPDDATRSTALAAAITEAQTAATAISAAAAGGGATAALVAAAANAAVAAAGIPGTAALIAAQQVAAAAQTEAAKPPYMTTAQRMDISGGPTGGSIKLSFKGVETATPIQFATLTDATAVTAENAVKTALEGLSSINPGNIASVVRSGATPNFSFLITFGGTLASPQNLIVVSGNSLTGGVSPTATVSFPLPDAGSVTAAAAAAAGAVNSPGPAVNYAAGEVAPINRARFTFANGLTIEAASPGAWGNSLQIKVDYDTKPKNDGTPDTTLYNLTITDQLTGKTERIRNVTGTPSATRLVSRVLADESSLVRAVGAVPASRPVTQRMDISGSPTGGTIKLKFGAAQTAAIPLTALANATPGTAENALKSALEVLATIGSGKIASVVRSGVIPNFSFLIAFGGSQVDPQSLITLSDNSLTGGTSPTVVISLATIGVDPAGKAADSQPLSASDFNGSPDNKTGLFALDKADLFNLLCVPPDTRDGDTDVTVYQKALDYCNSRRAMLIVDSLAAWSANPDTAAAAAIAGLPGLGLNGPAARNAALFFPRIKESDPMHDGQIDTFVPCGAIAGIFARTDSTRGVWKAPAGLDAAFNGIAGLEVNLADGENGQLNPLGINCLRSFPAAGQVVWGARTLRGADRMGDEYKYISVRRTALFIEESLYRGTQWVVFEPNDEPLWAQIRLNLGAFMHNLFRQGAFQGTTPRDAYFVKCDKETTTQNDIDLGIVNIVVGFAPLKPAEFVVIKLQQIAGQIAV